MTPLETIIRNHITANGPLPFATYMEWCLFHPDYGYYTMRDPIGAQGDFTTSPEISQLFGEMIALWCIERWLQLGAPSPFVLLECGPGHGTLMADILRASKAMPEFLAAARVHLLEKSPLLQRVQREKLQGHDVRWCNDLGQLPALPTIMVCNEFFDAFPVVRMADGIRQMVVLKNDQLALAPATGTITETSPAINAWMHEFTQHLAAHKGAALIIDYAYEGPRDVDSVQAMREHNFVSIFDQPGHSDLTAYVDYTQLAAIALTHGLKAEAVITQREFLLHYGLKERLDILKQRASADQVAQLETGAARLIDAMTPNHPGMGDMFRVLVLTT